MLGLLRKTLLETRFQLMLFGLGLGIVPGLLTSFLPQLEEGLSQVLAAFPFFRTFIQALLGEDLGENINPLNLQAIIWVHPTVLALLWAQEIIFCTRVPAGEIDRGTIDLLLSWPVSRRRIYVSETIVWLCTGVALCSMMLAGHLIARHFTPSTIELPIKRILTVLANLYCLYLAVGGLAFAISTACDQRGHAMAIVFTIVLISFLMNFLVQFWQPIAWMAPLSILHYYQPAEILANGNILWAKMFSLVIVGAASWLAGLEIFARRSISIV